MPGRFGSRDAGRRRTPDSGGAFQLGRILVITLIIVALVAVLVALLD